VDSPPSPLIKASSRRKETFQNRLQSLGPSREITCQKSCDIRGSDRHGQPQISVTSACSSTQHMSRPTKRIGCLGSSSNMTHHCRQSHDTGHEVDRETDRHLMKFFEEEMRMKRLNSKVSPLLKTRSTDKAEFRENLPHVVKSLEQSTVTGISH
jgi:hypothetical protein